MGVDGVKRCSCPVDCPGRRRSGAPRKHEHGNMPLLKTWIRVVTNASKVCTITMVRKQTLIFGARDDGLPRRAVADPVSSVGAVTVAVTVALSVAQPVTCSHGHRDHDIMVAAGHAPGAADSESESHCNRTTWCRTRRGHCDHDSVRHALGPGRARGS